MNLVWTSKPTLDADSENVLVGFLRALGHPVRLRLFRELLEKPDCPAGDLASTIPLSPSTVSEHLRVLKAAGLVECRVEGPRRYYAVRRDPLNLLRRLVRAL